MKPEFMNMSKFLKAALGRDGNSKNVSADTLVPVSELERRLSGVKASRASVMAELYSLEKFLDESIALSDSIMGDIKIKRQAPKATGIPEAPLAQAQTGAVAAQVPPQAASPVQGMSGLSLEDFKSYLEKMLQGSIESATNRMSDRIVNMLKELKTLSGPARDAKIMEIQQAAGEEVIDLSGLYAHDQVQSNIADVGVQERESKSVDSSLEKLRKMRGAKPGNAPDVKKG